MKITGYSMELAGSSTFHATESEQMNLAFKAGDALLDPLVVNLGSTSAALSGKKISFDINVDGSNEKIFVPQASSGFLVLDKNKNGKIDDGRELFGPQTGNGFQELAGYDSDNNGWIDENDPIYNNLQIWQHDEYGNSTLIAIGKAGVGAISLGSTQTTINMRIPGMIPRECFAGQEYT